MVAGRGRMGSARPPVACRVLPLAARGGARLSGRVAHRRERSVACGIQRRNATRSATLLRELELLAERARLDLVSPDAEPRREKQGMEELLG